MLRDALAACMAAYPCRLHRELELGSGGGGGRGAAPLWMASPRVARGDAGAGGEPGRAAVWQQSGRVAPVAVPHPRQCRCARAAVDVRGQRVVARPGSPLTEQFDAGECAIANEMPRQTADLLALMLEANWRRV
ncbi:hypothetical protein HK405_014604, partial [Cladochytrium tenue]